MKQFDVAIYSNAVVKNIYRVSATDRGRPWTWPGAERSSVSPRKSTVKRKLTSRSRRSNEIHQTPGDDPHP